MVQYLACESLLIIIRPEFSPHGYTPGATQRLGAVQRVSELRCRRKPLRYIGLGILSSDRTDKGQICMQFIVV